jgi:hypothetical protein
MTNVVPFGGTGDPPPSDHDVEKDDAAPVKKKTKEPDWGHFNNLLERFALIYSTDTVWDEGTGLIMKISAMAHAHGADYVRMWKNRPATHLRSESTREFDRRRWTVHPTTSSSIRRTRATPRLTINLFSGLDMEPKQGDVEPILELARYLTSRASDKPEECEAVLHWLMCWIAYPLQRPGAKLRCAVVMHGDEGAGKNFFFETLLEIYGEYGKAVGQDELEDKFNDWRSRTLFVRRRRGVEPAGAGAQQEPAEGADHVADGADQPEESAAPRRVEPHEHRVPVERAHAAGARQHRSALPRRLHAAGPRGRVLQEARRLAQMGRRCGLDVLPEALRPSRASIRTRRRRSLRRSWI